MRMVFEHQSEHGSQWATVNSIDQEIGCTREALQTDRSGYANDAPGASRLHTSKDCDTYVPSARSSPISSPSIAASAGILTTSVASPGSVIIGSPLSGVSVSPSRTRLRNRTF